MIKKPFTKHLAQRQFEILDTSPENRIALLSYIDRVYGGKEFIEIQKTPRLIFFNRQGEFVNNPVSAFTELVKFYEGNLIDARSITRYGSYFSSIINDTLINQIMVYAIVLTQEQLDGILEHNGGILIDTPTRRGYQPPSNEKMLAFKDAPPIHIGFEFTPEAAAAFHFDKDRKPQPGDFVPRVFLTPTDKDHERATYTNQINKLKRNDISTFTLASLGVCHNNIFNLMNDTLLGETSSVLTEMVRINKHQGAQLEALNAIALHLNSKLPVKDRLPKALLKPVRDYAAPTDITLSGPIALIKQLADAQQIITDTEFEALHNTFNRRNRSKNDEHDYYILAHRVLDPTYDELVADAITAERERMQAAGEKVAEDPVVSVPEEPTVAPSKPATPDTAPEAEEEPTEPPTPALVPETEPTPEPDTATPIDTPDDSVVESS